MERILQAIADNIFVIVACMVPVAIVGITTYFSHKRLEMVHRERLAAIEKGLIPPGELPDQPKDEPEQSEPGAPPNYLRRGLFWMGPGAGVVAFSLLFLSDTPAGVRLPILGVAMLCAGIGAAYLVIYFLENDRARHPLQ